jgi:DNA-binding XRE family transcriptional regulator
MANPLEAFRLKYDLTQGKAARVIGVSHSTWRQLERNWRGRQARPLILQHLDALDLLAEHKIAWPQRQDLEEDQC